MSITEKIKHLFGKISDSKIQEGGEKIDNCKIDLCMRSGDLKETEEKYLDYDEESIRMYVTASHLLDVCRYDDALLIASELEKKVKKNKPSFVNPVIIWFIKI